METDKKRGKRFLGISAIIVMVLVALALLPAVAVATTISIGDVTVSPGESATLSIMVNDVTDCGVAAITFSYDPSVVHVTEVKDSQFDVFDTTIDNETGEFEIAGLQFWSGGLDGTVQIASVTLKAIGTEGQWSFLNITIDELKTVGPPPQNIPANLDNGTFNIQMNNPPMPIITTPQDGATLFGFVTIREIDESGEEDIVYNLFEYYYDENCNREADDGNDWYEIGNDTDGSNGWSVNWYTTQYPDCCYMIRATMGDELGQTGQYEINVALSNHDPIPVITSPQDGSTVSGVITIEEIDASFEKGEDIVYNLFEYYYDENCNREADDGNDWYEIGNDTDGSDGWSVNWDTAQYPDCCYMIRATMGDKHGRTGTTGINVALSNHDPIPVITSPQNGATLSGLVTIEEVDISGEEDIVYNLFEYYYDENCNFEADDGNDWYEIGNDTDGSNGWSVNWDTAQYPDCCYMIRATMGDRHGGTGQDEINVTLSNHDPVPVITNPQDGDTLSGVVTIEEIDASFEEGADIVYNLFEYYYDENCNREADDGNDWYEIGNDTDGSDGWSIDWNTTQYPDCCYMIRATMGDKHGRTGTTAISVNIDNIPLIVTDATATPAVIPDDTDNDPRWGEIATLNVTVISHSSVSVTINLSAIGGSAVQPMTNIEGNIWSVTTNASDGKAGWNGTAYEPYLLQVNATTDVNSKSNTSESIELMVMKNGDVDGDGDVSYSDAMYLYKWKAGEPGFETIHETIADVDGSGDVSYSDAMYLYKWKAGEPGFEFLH